MAKLAQKHNVLTFTFAVTFLWGIAAQAQLPITTDPSFYGPYNGYFLPDGDGLKKALLKDDSILRADSPWSLYFWVRTDEALKAPSLLAGVGNVDDEEYPRYLGSDGSHVILWMGKDNSLSGPATLVAGRWQMLAATFDGAKFRLYCNGTEVTSGPLMLGSVSPVLHAAPPTLPSPEWKHFGGKLAQITLLRNALTQEEIQKLSQRPPDFATATFEDGSKPWPVQTRGQAGYRAPQDPSTMPRGKGPFSKPVAKPLPASHGALIAEGDSQWTIAGGWKLIAAPEINADAETMSHSGFSTATWMAATVPGTVLTTMIDRGVYADPDYGLNNLTIPESLNKQDYWYRNEFTAPKSARGPRSAVERRS